VKQTQTRTLELITTRAPPVRFGCFGIAEVAMAGIVSGEIDVATTPLDRFLSIKRSTLRLDQYGHAAWEKSV
jgi:hypothetical protein